MNTSRHQEVGKLTVHRSLRHLQPVRRKRCPILFHLASQSRSSEVSIFQIKLNFIPLFALLNLSYLSLTETTPSCCLLIYVDKLYWISDEKPPQNIPNAFFFNIDNVSRPWENSPIFFVLGFDLHAIQQGFRPSEPCHDTQILP